MTIRTPSRPSPGAPAEAALVNFRLLGEPTAIVAGAPAIWQGGGVGGHQLRAMTGTLVAHHDRPILREDLQQAAGRRWQLAPMRPKYVVSGLIAMLKGWGLGAALVDHPRSIQIDLSPLWWADIIAIEQAMAEAMAYQAARWIEAALTRLTQAEALCGGHLLGKHAPTHSTTVAQLIAHWDAYQLQVRTTLITWCIAADDPARHQQAMAVAQRMLQSQRPTAAMYTLAARAYGWAGMHQLADHYNQRAASWGEAP